MAAGAGREFDVAVVGLGGLGSAAAYWLARRGVNVVGFEQFELGHVRGASHDHSRIIRRSYHTPEYVRLAAQAYDAWRAVEAESRQRMITITGGVDLFPVDAAIDHRSYTTSLDAERVPYEWIDGAEIRRRWPAFAAGSLVTDDVMGVYSPQTGIVPAGPGTKVMQELAVARGAVLRSNTPVRAIRPVGGEVDIVTDDGVQRVGSVVITADAWTNRVLHDLDLRFRWRCCVSRSATSRTRTSTPFGSGASRCGSGWTTQLLRLPGVRRHGCGEGCRGLRRP
jgi:sarcosine oxidase